VAVGRCHFGGRTGPLEVSDDLQGAREAEVGIDGAGNAVFVWARYDPADDLILARTLRANGSLEAGRTLSVFGASAEETEVAVNEVGDAAFAWTRWDGMRDRVQGPRRSRLKPAWEQPVAVGRRPGRI
jgi:hypothetical protein